MKEVEEDTDTWEDSCKHRFGKIDIVKMSVQSKAIYRFDEITSKIPIALFKKEIKKF